MCTKKNATILTFLLTVLCIAASCRKADSSGSVLWYEPSKAFDASCTDVLYITSTDVLSATDEAGNTSWQATLCRDDLEAMGGEIAWVEKNMFGEGFNFYAPFYRQFTFDAICELDRGEFSKVYAKVVEDVCMAFDDYMAHKNNGRPFILAGFSQGAMLTLDLLRHMSDEEYARMIACYTMGYRLSAEDLRHPHIKAATGETDRGVVISFNSTQSIDAIWHALSDGAVTCMNPVNWKTDSTEAAFSFEGTCNRVHVDQEHRVLLIDSDKPYYFSAQMDRMSFFAKAGVHRDNLHHWDLLFYAGAIHENALRRSEGAVSNSCGN